MYFLRTAGTGSRHQAGSGDMQGGIPVQMLIRKMERSSPTKPPPWRYREQQELARRVIVSVTAEETVRVYALCPLIFLGSASFYRWNWQKWSPKKGQNGYIKEWNKARWLKDCGILIKMMYLRTSVWSLFMSSLGTKENGQAGSGGEEDGSGTPPVPPRRKDKRRHNTPPRPQSNGLPPTPKVHMGACFSKVLFSVLPVTTLIEWMYCLYFL